MATQTEARKAGFRSLTVTLALAFLFLSLVVLLIASGLQLYFNFQTQQQTVVSQQRLIAQSAANTVSSFMQEKFSIMETTASLSSILTAQQKEQKLIMDKLLGREPSFRQLVLLDRRGEHLAEVSRLSGSASGKLADRLDGNLLNQTENGKRYIGSVYIDAVTSEPMVIMTVPVTDVFGDFQGTLAAEVNLKFIWELVGSIKIGSSGLAYVVDRQGNLIAFGDISRVLKGENLVRLEEVNSFVNGGGNSSGGEAAASEGIRGDAVIANYVPLGTPDWAVVVEMPVQEAYGPVIQQLEFAILIIILTIILAVMLGIYLSRRITKPIIKLKDAVTKIGTGKLDTRIEIKSRDEIGELAQSFNQMIQDLKKSHEQIKTHAEELENKVSERTAELGSKVKELETSRVAILNMMEDSEEVNKQLVKTQEDLKNAMDELKKTDVKKDEFISVTAHEFKTPLTAIHGFAELLQDKKIDVKSTKKYLTIIKEETERLSKLVTEILNLSRIDLGTLKLTYEDIDLYSMIETIRSEADIKIKARGLKSAYELEKKLPKIESDREKLTEILLNLLDNAAKYTNQGTITAKISREKDSMHFIVKDTGIGIPEEAQKKIFERFYQVDSSNTRKVGGTGLGLALSREYVVTMGGKMWFVSEAGKGTEFHFTLPIKAPKKDEAKEKYEGKTDLFKR